MSLLLVPFVLVLLLGVVVASVLQSVVWFGLAALWESDSSGWEAFSAATRVALRHPLPLVGVSLLFVLLGLAAALLGLALLCIGLFLTVPVVMVWMTATFAHLYRNWAAEPVHSRLG